MLTPSGFGTSVKPSFLGSIFRRPRLAVTQQWWRGLATETHVDVPPSPSRSKATEEKTSKVEFQAPKTRYDAIGLLSDLLSTHHTVLFIKGTVEQPKCGHSKRFLDTLFSAGLQKFVAVDVLESDIVRQTIKELGQTNSIPMLFIKGEFIGGADRVAELHEKEELKPLLGLCDM
eukprot:Blabericola_migrator_1__5910@NODE_2991_length_2135_cov_25_341393_g1871_i0_p1_GENE_NODE_2991_length_2135_cov_25_341393_g1871_i0NODE_2991_length_2135_cov_25_341393_g1871_i0_p1_ORF_typecomplete_len174_score37_60Glutaredoxin/PF00462_24/4_7e09SH3BGR/PF04908_15/7_7e06_NODE_2991_length_2135_cov_25_341393_g1871_i015502071